MLTSYRTQIPVPPQTDLFHRLSTCWSVLGANKGGHGVSVTADSTPNRRAPGTSMVLPPVNLNEQTSMLSLHRGPNANRDSARILPGCCLRPMCTSVLPHSDSTPWDIMFTYNACFGLSFKNPSTSLKTVSSKCEFSHLFFFFPLTSHVGWMMSDFSP